MDSSNFIPQVNASMIGNYLNREVMILAELSKAGDKQIEIICSDQEKIKVILAEPLRQLIPEKSILRLIATPLNRTLVQCKDLIVLPNNEDDLFDFKLYNETIKLLAERVDENSYMINDVSEHFGSKNPKDVDLIDKLDANNEMQIDKNEQSFF